jgi:hypothetical protein
MNSQFMSDYDAATAAFRYTGGAVRLQEPVTDPIIRGMEWGHAEKDEYTVPFGPWSKPETVSAGPWVYRYGTASAGTGSRYSVLLTRVHGDVAAREGGPVIVSVLAPWSDTYALAEQGYLDHTYVAEKLTGGRARSGQLHGGDLAALTKLIGILMGREVG